MYHYAVKNSHCPDPTGPLNNWALCMFKTHFNIIRPSTSCCYKYSVSSRLSHQTPVLTSFKPHLPSIYNCKNIWQGTQIKSHTYSPAPAVLPLRTRYPPQDLIIEIPQSPFLPYRDHVSHPHIKPCAYNLLTYSMAQSPS